MPRPLPPHVMAATGGRHEAVRDHILDAAHRVIARQGLAAASTRAIAEEAEIGAGTLYNYFEDRLQLLALAMLRQAHVRSQPLADLPTRAGADTVAGNLRRFARRVEAMLDELVPLFAAAFSDMELLPALHREMDAHQGPDGPFVIAPIERYLLAERELGRVSADADCRAAASLLVSVCHDRAFERFFHGGAGPRRPFDAEIDLIALAVSVPRVPPVSGDRSDASARTDPTS
jgi:AcrR family transcriptional regulator